MPKLVEFQQAYSGVRMAVNPAGIACIYLPAPRQGGENWERVGSEFGPKFETGCYIQLIGSPDEIGLVEAFEQVVAVIERN